jgi:hypothetical protein
MLNVILWGLLAWTVVGAVAFTVLAGKDFGTRASWAVILLGGPLAWALLVFALAVFRGWRK